MKTFIIALVGIQNRYLTTLQCTLRYISLFYFTFFTQATLLQQQIEINKLGCASPSSWWIFYILLNSFLIFSKLQMHYYMVSSNDDHSYQTDISPFLNFPKLRFSIYSALSHSQNQNKTRKFFRTFLLGCCFWCKLSETFGWLLNCGRRL